MLEKLSKMSTREAISILAGPYHGNRDRWLANAAKEVAGVSFRTMRSLWHGEIEDPEHLAALAVKRQAEIVKVQNAARELASTFETLAGGLKSRDQDFHGNDIAALIDAARILRGLDRT